MTERPNILYLHSHDTGRYVQPYGHQVPTPNIQLLADQGVLFRQAFSAAPTCSGSRAALLTGQYPHVNGMMGLAHRGWKLNDYDHHLVATLRAAGYHTELIGEQHVSATPDVLGYDVAHEIRSNHVETVAPLTRDVIARGPREPFFLSVGFFETHRSFFEPSSVRDALYSLPPDGMPDTPAVRSDVAALKASARSLDHGVGSVLHALHAAGIADRTLVVCTTDHGLAFPRAKGTLYDRGIGAMLILRGPGGFAGGRVVDSLASHLDVYPTLCEAAGIEVPAFVQGESLVAVARGERARARDAIFAELTYHAAYDPHRAVRTERHKYIRRFSDYALPVLPNTDDSPTKDTLIAAGWAERPRPAEELYDLVLDPSETDNRATDPVLARVRARLAERLERWMAETGDPLLDGPVPPPAGAAVNRPEQRSASDPTYVPSEPAAV